MKKKVRMLSILAIAVTLSTAGAAMAWFSDAAAPVTNIFNAGTIAITLNDNLAGQDFPQLGINNINPGDFYDKEVSVTSTGSKETYVRVKLTPLLTPREGYEGDSLSNDVVSMNIDNTNWVLGDDGWYYYKYILTADSPDTTKLLDGITFSGPLMDNDYQAATFSISVQAEASQASHYAFVSTWGISGIPGSLAPGAVVPQAGVQEWVPVN
jgi:hypothetical protein